MIALSMNRTDYENDIRSLLMAFFYGEKIVLNGEEWNVCLDVRYTENHTALVLKDHNGEVLKKKATVILKIIVWEEMISRTLSIVFCRNIPGWCCHGGH